MAGQALSRSWATVRLAWETMWRHPAIFNLVFWALMLVILVDWIAVARLLPLLPKGLATASADGRTTEVLRLSKHVTGATVSRLLIFILAVFLIVTPFQCAGLYGGAWKLIQQPTPLGSPLQFFASGWRAFWRGFTVTLWGALAGVLLFIVVGLFTGFLGAVGAVLSIVLGLWALGTAWVGLGTLMAEPERPSRAVVQEVLAFGIHRWADVVTVAVVAMVLMAAALFLLDVVSGIPILGLILSIVCLGVILAFTTTLPFALYLGWHQNP